MFVCVINFINFAEITNYISTMLNKILIIITLLCSPIVMSAQFTFDANPDYIPAGQSNEFKFYLNTKKIIKDYDGYHVWIAFYKYNDGVKVRKNNTKSKKHKTVQKKFYTLENMIINLEESKIKIVSGVDYDTHGNLLHYDNNIGSDWIYIIPNSVLEAVTETFKQYISDNPIE